MWMKTQARDKKNLWVRKIFQELNIYDLYHILTNELRLFDKEHFFRFVRMAHQRFKHLLLLVGPYLKRTTRSMSEPTSAAERLVLTLWFLASADSQQSLCFSFRISQAAICTTLSEEKKSTKNDDFFCQWRIFLPNNVLTDDSFLPTNIIPDIFLQTRTLSIL